MSANLFSTDSLVKVREERVKERGSHFRLPLPPRERKGILTKLTNSPSPLGASIPLFIVWPPLENQMTREREREGVTQVNIYKSQARFRLLIFD
jgi:hypothetical protein